MSPDLAELLETQSGVLTSRQAAQYGLTRHAVQHQVAAGRWQRALVGVYVTHTGQLEYLQRVWVGVLYAGRQAVVSHRSAWWLHDRKLAEPEAVHVTVPFARVVCSQPGLTVHRTRQLVAEDLHPSPSPPRFRVERAVLECASAAVDSGQATALLAQAVQRRITTPERLQSTLSRMVNAPRAALLRQVLTLTGEGAHSLLEVLHDRECSAHGLPKPHRQRRLGAARVDALYECPNGVVVAELDGRLGHFDAEGWWLDMDRDNQHTLDGRASLRFPGFLLLTSPHEVAHTIGLALRRRGWTGAFRCPPACPGRLHGFTV